MPYYRNTIFRSRIPTALLHQGGPRKWPVVHPGGPSISTETRELENPSPTSGSRNKPGI